jgi:hypothetical protein
MKRAILDLALGLLILLSGKAWADSPIYQGFQNVDWGRATLTI